MCQIKVYSMKPLFTYLGMNDRKGAGPKSIHANTAPRLPSPIISLTYPYNIVDKLQFINILATIQ